MVLPAAHPGSLVAAQPLCIFTCDTKLDDLGLEVLS